MGLWTWINGQDAIDRKFTESMNGATKEDTWAFVQVAATKTLRGRFPDRNVQRLIAWNVSAALEGPALDHGPLNNRLYDAFMRNGPKPNPSTWAGTRSRPR